VQAPSAFGGFDLFGRIVAGRTYAEPYDIGLALPICRDAAPGAVLAQTVFPDGADARVSRWRLWRGVSRGSNATIVWSSHDAVRWDDATKSYAPTEYGRALSADLARLTAPGGLGERLASTFAFDEEIAIVVSQTSIRVRWMLDSVEDGATWPRRFGSYEATHSTAIRSREAAWRALAQRGARFRPARPLDTSKLGLPTRVVVLPDAIALDDATTESLAAAARAGVLVVADVEPAQFDEFGRARAPGSGGVAGSIVDPEFATLAARVEKAIGPPLLRATATRADGGPAPPIEIGLRRAADGTTFAVCLAVWDVTTGADGAAQGRVPATELTVEFTFGDGAPHPVRDEWASNDLGPVRTWTARTDAALPLVWSWPAR
jgi:hypothetical protein